MLGVTVVVGVVHAIARGVLVLNEAVVAGQRYQMEGSCGKGAAELFPFSLVPSSDGSVTTAPSSRMMSSVVTDEPEAQDSVLPALKPEEKVAGIVAAMPVALLSCECEELLRLARDAPAAEAPELLRGIPVEVEFSEAELERRDGLEVEGTAFAWAQVIGLNGLNSCWISLDFLKSALKRRPPRA
ncbi:hypothetical protein HK101_000968 [Irineochytrium annulatum]|nr:hypothetical protein HK101_000968 [Irineochytrium annulatum]